MNNIPLSDASFSEVLARVAFQLIRRRMKLLSSMGENPYSWSENLPRQLDRAGWTALSAWSSAYAFHHAKGELPGFTRTAFIMRARSGMGFRSVMYAEYKAQRRRAPRVTNRGGRGTAGEETEQ